MTDPEESPLALPFEEALCVSKFSRQIRVATLLIEHVAVAVVQSIYARVKQRLAVAIDRLEPRPKRRPRSSAPSQTTKLNL